jgi:uncharacterized membrane protein
MLLSILSYTFAGALFVALGIPLMRRRVPLNGAYGLRVPATCADERVWYEANARTGRDFVVLGVVMVLLALGIPLLPVVSKLAYDIVLTALTIGGVIAVAAVGWIRASRILRARQADELGPT